MTSNQYGLLTEDTLHIKKISDKTLHIVIES